MTAIDARDPEKLAYALRFPAERDASTVAVVARRRNQRLRVIDYRMPGIQPPMALTTSATEALVELDKQLRESGTDDPGPLTDIEALTVRSPRVRHPRRFQDLDRSIWD